MATTKKRAAPKPRTIPKKAPRFCDGGHRMSTAWKVGQPCWQFDQAERARALADPSIARAQREAAMAEIGPTPDVLTMRCGDGTVIRHAIPKHLRPARRKGYGRRP